MPADPVLELDDVTVHYPVHRAGARGPGKGVVRALEGASLRLYAGRITALVGESGSGKSTLARVLALAQRPTEGSLLLRGERMEPGGRRVRKAYARRVQMVPQDPFGALNPLHTVRRLLTRPLRLHGTVADADDLDRQLRTLLERVRLTPPERFLDAYPHELSGGQRQRISIARALAVRPEVVLGDEPVSMLDVSIRLDVLNLLAALRDEEALAMLYITHDIAGARYIADEITVMYAGEMVESGPAERVTQRPGHPYTRLLLAASPDPSRDGFLTDPSGDAEGEPPDLTAPPSGCRFHPRCPLAVARCSAEAPPPVGLADGHWARCWLAEPAEKGL